MLNADPTQRFTRHAHDYARSRPGYPEALLGVLARECGLRREHVIADLGAGTGLLTMVFARAGHRVFAVEPNAAMRAEAAARLRLWSGCSLLDTRAEATGLAAGSVDCAVAGAAFHWFDPEPTRAELRRILAPDGWFVVVANRRRTEAGGATQALDELLTRFNRHPAAARRRLRDEALTAFFGTDGCRRVSLPHGQRLDAPGWRGLLGSFSSLPAAGQPGHGALLAAADEAFAAHQHHGRVTLAYTTVLTFGRVGADLGLDCTEFPAGGA
jgi:SAM-dependent methyltransferase